MDKLIKNELNDAKVIAGVLLAGGKASRMGA